MAQVRALRFGTHVARGVRRLAADAALRGHRDFPRTIGNLTPGNLSAITGRHVTSVSLLDGASGTSSRARLALTGTDVPESVFVKMSAASAGIRMLGELAGLGETEAKFYRHLAAELGSGVPRSYGADFDPLTGRYVVVLEDMTTSPCQFPDTLHPLDKDQMGQLIECFAHLHAHLLGPAARPAIRKAPRRRTIRLVDGAFGRPRQPGHTVDDEDVGPQAGGAHIGGRRHGSCGRTSRPSPR